MEFNIFNIFFCLLIFIYFNVIIFGKPLNEFNKNEISKGNIDKKIQRDLVDDPYLLLQFSENCTYPLGFYSNIRNNINYIINRENNLKLTGEDPLTINKNFAIELHFDLVNLDFGEYFSVNIDENMKYLQLVDFDNIQTSLIIDMRSMFEGCSSLQSIYLSDLDFSKVFEMDKMFSGCSSLSSVYLSNLDMSSVISMGYIFNGCNSLKEVYISKVKTSSLLYMSSMFSGCSSLVSLEISYFDTSLVSNMQSLFYGCSSLTSINLSYFNTQSLRAMDEMFYGCNSLNILDLSNFDMSICNSYNDIFSYIDNIIYINLYNFQNDKVMSAIFNYAENLIICQKDKIVTNPNIYNCCDYNYITNKCKLENGTELSLPFKDFTFPDSTDESSNSGKTSSSSISIDIIIGIIGGILVIIAIVIIIIFCFLKPCNKKAKTPENTTNINLTISPTPIDTLSGLNMSEINRQKVSEIYEYEPKGEKKSQTIIIIFETTEQSKISILIGLNKKIKELIKFYFKIINRPDLFGDQSILFLQKGVCIMHDSDEEIKTFTKKKDGFFIILVDDSEDKIKKNEK